MLHLKEEVEKHENCSIRTVIGCCVYDREGMIEVYRAVYAVEPNPIGGGEIDRLLYGQTRTLRFPYDVRDNGHPTPEQILDILKMNGRTDFFEGA